MRSRAVFAMVGWLVAAAVATVAGLGAVRVIGDGITGTAATTLTEEEVAEALASPVPPTTAGPRPTPSTTAGTGTLLTHDAGRVVASCGGGLVTLVSWSPAQGYQVTDYEKGPAEEAEVTFDRGGEGHGSGEVELHIACRAGTPEITRIDD